MIVMDEMESARRSPLRVAHWAAAFSFAVLSGCAVDAGTADIDNAGEAATAEEQVDLGVKEQALNPGQSGWLAWYGPQFHDIEAMAKDSCSNRAEVTLQNNGDIYYKPESVGNNTRLGNAWHAADIACDGPTRLFAFNRDRTIWVANIEQTPLTFTYVGNPWNTRQIEFAMGYLWAYNEDNTLWRSASGRDGTWTKIGNPGSKLRIAGSSNKLFAVNAAGYIFAGSGSDSGWMQLGYAKAAKDIWGRPDGNNYLGALMAPEMNGWQPNYWAQPLSNWSGFTNPPQFRPPSSPPPPTSPYTWIDFVCYCGGYHLDNNALWVEPRYWAARGCQSASGNIGFNVGASCGTVCTKLRLRDLGGAGYVSAYSFPMPGTTCNQDSTNFAYPL